MNGCEGCFSSAKGQARELDQVRTEAKIYAVKHGKTVAIYKEVQGYGFICADQAAGLIILEYISAFDGATP
jgi:hypothetical protein